MQSFDRTTNCLVSQLGSVGFYIKCSDGREVLLTVSEESNILGCHIILRVEEQWSEQRLLDDVLVQLLVLLITRLEVDLRVRLLQKSVDFWRGPLEGVLGLTLELADHLAWRHITSHRKEVHRVVGTGDCRRRILDGDRFPSHLNSDVSECLRESWLEGRRHYGAGH